ncbi:MAG: two-component sensor histidine kinase [Anaerophaga sp.]|uniref:sensor histidine kinase n=1 Tax=Anaerophaga thermohalophila TaxID=177400 RepID=UPI000237C091|nr:sensor histidine kinase [Anaerophaga thermohalophila]MBZ4677136.1 two-component sensor histidine kinase [Anaerophaga sp.]
MIIQLALLTAVILQLGAFFKTLGLIRKTRFNVSWITISIAFFLMAIRRVSELLDFTQNAELSRIDLFNTWVAVFISLLMFVASFYIRRIFNLQEEIDKMRKQNEARVLSAIIDTEEKERQLFARELHDGLGPILSSVKMAFSAINKEEIGDKNKVIMERTEKSVDHAVMAVREISNNLSPHLLDTFGLLKAIRSFYNAIAITKKPELDVENCFIPPKLPKNIEVILYRILCELINNTLKHADASKINIVIFEQSGILELNYSDDGCGFDLKQKKHQGNGLDNISSRVKSLNGKVQMHSKSNNGFFIKINIPL